MSRQENRVRYNQSNYRRVFGDVPIEMEKLERSEAEPSLSTCVQKWLERTPGLEEDGFNFPKKFQDAVEGIMKREEEAILVGTCSGCVRVPVK
jgi:tryptophan 2,3-dioxygenase